MLVSVKAKAEAFYYFVGAKRLTESVNYLEVSNKKHSESYVANLERSSFLN